MDKLFYSLQRNKQFKRQVTILTYLSQKTTVVSNTELANELNVRPATIQSDIEELNNLFSPELMILTSFRKGYKLVLENTVSIENFLTFLAEETIPFKIMNLLLNSEIHPLSELAEKFHISESSLLREIVHINTVLAKYDIQLSKNTVDFVGDESDIRFFFYIFYSDFRDCFVVESEKLLFGDESLNFPHSTEFYNFDTLNLQVSYYQSILWLSIFKKRVSNGYFVQIDEKLKKDISKTNSFLRFNAYINNYFDFLFKNVTLPLEEVIWAYIVNLNNIIYNDDRNIYICRRNDDYMLSDITSIHLFLEKTLSFFNLKDQHDNAYYQIESFLINILLLSKLTSRFQMISPMSKQSVERHYFDIFHKWETFLTQENHLFSFEYIEDIATTLTILTKSCMLKMEKKEIFHVLLSFYGEAGYQILLKQLCEKYLGPNVKTSFIVDRPISQDIIDQANISLVITNYSSHFLNTVSCPTMQFSYILKKSEWVILKDTLSNIERYLQKLPSA